VASGRPKPLIVVRLVRSGWWRRQLSRRPRSEKPSRGE